MTPDLLGSVGAWSGRLQRRPTGEAIEIVDELGELGYGSVWIPESPFGKNVLTFAAVLLGGTTGVTVATGIAITWVRDPVAMMNASRTLGDAFPERFVLGIGISHQSTAEIRGHVYRQPVTSMSHYVTAMRNAGFDGHPPVWTPPILVAALGPKMLRLAGDLADGAHPFLTTPEHTGQAREALGADRLLAVEQGVVLADRTDGRAVARSNLTRFLQWPNYQQHLRRLGFGDHDFVGGGSDRLVDAVYAIGDETEIAERILEHRRNGADHVCLQVISADDIDEVVVHRRLAPVVGEI